MKVPTKYVVIGGVILALVLAGVVSYYASGAPDGLQHVAGEKGFLGNAKEHGSAGSPLAGYGTKGIDNDRLSGGLAGVVGTLVVLLVAGGLTLLVRRRKQR